MLTHALHYASSVFEGQRAYNGKIFKLTEHSTRLRNSAALLGFELPWSVEEIDAACGEVLEANNCTDAYMRPVAWRGSESDGRRRRATPGRISPSPPGNGANISIREMARRRASASTSRRGAGRRPTPRRPKARRPACT